MGTVTLPLIHGQGTPETVWREWLTGQRFPSADLAFLVPLGSRLVVAAPHPDDEILACGGLLAACVQSRVPVRVIGLTDGDASHGTDDPLAMRQLAVQRRVESCAGLRVLGLAARNVVRWHIPDGCVRQYQARITQAMIRLLQPSDVVVTPWAMDGHPTMTRRVMPSAQPAAPWAAQCCRRLCGCGTGRRLAMRACRGRRWWR